MRKRDLVLDRCRSMIREGSKSFSAASMLFDPKTRDAAHLLYAWCRHCDDQIDGEQLGHDPAPRDDAARARRLDDVLAKTQRALRGEVLDDPVFVAFGRVAAAYAIPRRYPLELLDGFAMDVAGRCYPTLDDLLCYCYHIAGTVGLMMAHVMGVRDEWTLRRAADLGIALQLTNIARDVVDDARQGRVYLPLDWLAERGVAPESISMSSDRRPLADLVARLLSEAEHYYGSGTCGIRRLPFRGAWAVAAARNVYSEIGREVLRRGERAWDERVIVSAGRKRALMAQGLGEALYARSVGRLRAESPRPNLWTKDEASFD